MPDGKTIFSPKVENYVRYRPDYPQAFLTYLKEFAGFSSESVVADIGSGTGILSRALAPLVKRVYAVEPNPDMREASRNSHPGGRIMETDGSAEATALPAQSVNFITAGQSFHWFDADRARAEFRRILRPGGRVVLVWNVRDSGTSPFLAAYNAFLTPYADGFVRAKNSDPRVYEEMADRFFPEGYDRNVWPHEQQLNAAGFIGRSLSSSFAPLPGSDGYEPFVKGLRDLFAHYQQNGRLCFPYRTTCYCGRL